MTQQAPQDKNCRKIVDAPEILLEDLPLDATDLVTT